MKEQVGGPASQGLAGDFYLRNDVVRAVVQAPGRAMGPCPWGGNVIDLDCVAKPAGDQLGEVSPFLALGRTVNFTEVQRRHGRQRRRAGGDRGRRATMPSTTSSTSTVSAASRCAALSEALRPTLAARGCK